MHLTNEFQIKQKLTKLKGELDKHTITLGDLTSLSVTNRSGQQKIKDTDMKNTTSQLVSTDVDTTLPDHRADVLFKCTLKTDQDIPSSGA